MYIHTCIYMGFSGGTAVKKPPANAKDSGFVGSIPGLGRSPGGGHGNSLQYSWLENTMDRGAWQAIVRGGHKEWDTNEHTYTHIYTIYVCTIYTHVLLWWLSSKESTCNAGDAGLTLDREDPLRRKWQPHSSILAWKIPWTKKTGSLQCTGSQSWTQLSDWAYIHVYICVCVYICIYMCVYIYVCIHVYAYFCGFLWRKHHKEYTKLYFKKGDMVYIQETGWWVSNVTIIKTSLKIVIYYVANTYLNTLLTFCI